MVDVVAADLERAIEDAIQRTIAVGEPCVVDVYQYKRKNTLTIVISWDDLHNEVIEIENSYAHLESDYHWGRIIINRLLDAGILVAIMSDRVGNEFCDKEHKIVIRAYTYCVRGDEQDLLLAKLKYGGEILD